MYNMMMDVCLDDSFLQEPFKRILVIWVILEDTLGKRLSLYERNGLSHLITEWKQAFVRANVVVFPHYSSAVRLIKLFDTVKISFE